MAKWSSLVTAWLGCFMNEPTAPSDIRAARREAFCRRYRDDWTQRGEVTKVGINNKSTAKSSPLIRRTYNRGGVTVKPICEHFRKCAQNVEQDRWRARPSLTKSVYFRSDLFSR